MAKATIKKAIIKKAAPKKAAPKKAPGQKRRNYLTKRILISAATNGFTEAAARTMEVMGANVIVQNGWVVRKLADGNIERIAKIKHPPKVTLD
jgi:hypothetical protein